MAKDVEVTEAVEKLKPNKSHSLDQLARYLGGSMKRRGIPQMLDWKTIPIGGIVAGEIIAILNSPNSSIEGKLLHLRMESGNEISAPITGSIRKALSENLEEEVGKKFAAVRLDDKISEKYKKNMYIFDVYTS